MRDLERSYLLRLIDLAVESCEERNLLERHELPRWIADLVAQLQAARGARELSLPADTIAAHGQLLDLRADYMPNRNDLEAEEDAPPPSRSPGVVGDRHCRHCQRPIGEATKRWECSNCRKTRRLIRWAEAALAS